ncbi:MAG TPA: Gfo/Idh/MocA family oxidoreductase [Ignavibacteriales bacterium]|nr:Gfo/Idh/MocA family oxidoreductase [Ignavibacteriales bacterium]
MKVGIVGLGYWGPNLVRNFQADTEIEKVIGCDKEQERLNFIKLRFPNVDLTDSLDELLMSDVDAIAIATPVNTHYKFAKMALEAGKHIWVEKPFTSNSMQARDLIDFAEKRNLRIFVDHTFLYTGAVKKIKEIVDSGELGDIIYFDSVRINLGLFQHDVNVIWDLVPHDLAIMNYVLQGKIPVAVTANGIANYYDQENIAHISIHFKNESCFAHFHVNWTSPVKIRRMILAGTKKMLVYDDMENSEKIKVYDCGIEMLTSKEKIRKALVQYRIGDMYSPKVIQTEALAVGVKEFVSSIKEGRQPLTNGKDGLEVVRILEASDRSIKNRGCLIELEEKRKRKPAIKEFEREDFVKKIRIMSNGL